MTRAECESKIAEHFEAIIKIAKEYNPEGKYISASYCECDKGNVYQVNNEYFENDEQFPINFTKRIFAPWKSVSVEYDTLTYSYTVWVDGKVMCEHLTDDELSEVVQELMVSRKEE